MSNKAANVDVEVVPIRSVEARLDPTDPEASPSNGRVPPELTRWQKGQSGNPSGRPRGARTSLDATFEAELERLVPGDRLLDRGQRITRRTRLVRAVLSACETGDAAVMRVVLDRLWPKEKSDDPGQKIPSMIFAPEEMHEELRKRGLAGPGTGVLLFDTQDLEL